jgi:hypothetical protein
VPDYLIRNGYCLVRVRFFGHCGAQEWFGRINDGHDRSLWPFKDHPLTRYKNCPAIFVFSICKSLNATKTPC